MQEAILAEVSDALTDLFDSVEMLDNTDGMTRFRGTLVIADREVTVRVVFHDDFPLSLPAFKLEPWDALGQIPHVLPSEVVCFLNQEGMVLDESRPGAIVRDAFARMRKVLDDGVSGENTLDFVDEFEACWSYLHPAQTFYLVSKPGDQMEALDSRGFEEGGGLVGQNEHAIQRLFPSARLSQRYRRDAVVFLPLEPGSFVQPPNPEEPFWSAKDVRDILVTQLSESNREGLRKVLQRQRTTGETAIIGLPRLKGGVALFGITFNGIGPIHPLLPSGTAEEVSPAVVRRLDPAFLLGRGGAATDLRRKSVLVVGCGSLGGRVAFELARTGIGTLTLVDSDDLEPENTFRHVLGKEYWWKNKAAALKATIDQQVPYITVKAVDTTIELALAARIVGFERYDLVVFAIGEPTIELRMNHLLAGLTKAPPAVFTWLEPLGIGGHALLVQPTSNGCLRCLFEDAYDPDIGLYNRAAFAAPGQFFGRDFSGCGSYFTPFSSLDASSTAVLASRLSMDALTGRELGNPLLSWKGEADEFTAQGFELSDRHRRSEGQLFDHRYAYRADGCAVCGRPGQGDAITR